MATTERQPPSSVEGSSPSRPTMFHRLSDNAIDETSDADSDFVNLQKTISKERREARESPQARLQRACPFTFHPNIRPLSKFDYESCVALENAAFPDPAHRATPEKFDYRLSTCPELSLGVFCTVVPEKAKNWTIETLDTAKPVETDRPNGAKSVMVAHIVSTRCTGNTITDKDMDYPKDWRSRYGRSADVGHQETGRTVALHSMAVAPKLHGCGIGQMIMKAYLQQMKDAQVADRVALICQDYLVTYYERLGFKCIGKSPVEFGGGGWHDMVIDLVSYEVKAVKTPS
ncbi:polyamine acetyltransferase [Neurospora intermedia]|uniref:Polyamine acetyltransferase n=1 Tax=Neurospora intermedia TaxID=5142 RepID=A0ABR3DFR9_NEUIN